MERQQWQPWLIGAIHLWLIVSPHVLGVPFADADQAGTFRWGFVGPGAAVVLLSVGAMSAHQTWEVGLAGAMGLWVIFSPWIGGFVEEQSALMSAVASGVALVAIGGWAMLMDGSSRAKRPADGGLVSPRSRRLGGPSTCPSG